MFQEVKACGSASLLRTLFKVSFMGWGTQIIPSKEKSTEKFVTILFSAATIWSVISRNGHNNFPPCVHTPGESLLSLTQGLAMRFVLVSRTISKYSTTRDLKIG